MNENTLKRQWERADREATDNSISALMKHREGRKFLWWLLEQTGVNNQPFTGNALSTSFHCGEMNVGQKFLDRILSVSPEGYIEMMKENQSERRERDAELERVRDGDAGD